MSFQPDYQTSDVFCDGKTFHLTHVWGRVVCHKKKEAESSNGGMKTAFVKLFPDGRLMSAAKTERQIPTQV